MYYKMNRFELEMYVKELWKRVFFTTEAKKGPIRTEREIKRRTKEYQQLVISLKFFKDSKEKESVTDEKENSYVEPIYTDEDKEFLKVAVANGELTADDLTYEETFIVGLTSGDHCRSTRKIFGFNFDNKKQEKEFYKRLNEINMNTLTYNVALNLHKQIKKK